MKVVYTHTTAKELAEELIEMGYSTSTVFHLTSGESYNVYGMVVWRKVLNLLIYSEATGLSHWYPIKLFDIVDGRLPSNWHFAVLRSEQDSFEAAVWGYPELTADRGRHYFDLIERDPVAKEIFESRKRECDLES